MKLMRRAAMAAFIPALTLLPFFTPSGMDARDATPAAAYSCQTTMIASPTAGTPTGAMDDMTGIDMGTPMAGMSAEVDQRYIDMMIPHHASIIALAQAAQDRLTDERLTAIAENIITTQEAEIEELRGYREQFYGSPEPMPMDETIASMMEMMPNMDDMAMLMDPKAVAANFCEAEDPDLAFIDLTIPHHQMAIMASEAVLEQATHEEILSVAERVIHDQQQEIDELQIIRDELASEGTPGT
jgi:uncharacterized protein (DUF305 family)